MSKIAIKFWGRLSGFEPDLFKQYNTETIPNFASNLFESTKYEAKITELKSGGVIYRVNSDKNCLAVSVISTETYGAKWGAGREGAFLACTYFVPNNVDVNTDLFKSLNKSLESAINFIEINNGEIPLLSPDLQQMVNDVSSNASLISSNKIYNKEAVSFSDKTEVYSISYSQLNDVLNCFANVVFEGSFYLVDFHDENNAHVRTAKSFQDLKKSLTPAPKIRGCTDPKAQNYNPRANVEDGSCFYPPKPKIPFIQIGFASVLLLSAGLIFYDYFSADENGIPGESPKITDTTGAPEDTPPDTPPDTSSKSRGDGPYGDSAT